jgi:hypothetical protein
MLRASRDRTGVMQETRSRRRQDNEIHDRRRNNERGDQDQRPTTHNGTSLGLAQTVDRR